MAGRNSKTILQVLMIIIGTVLILFIMKIMFNGATITDIATIAVLGLVMFLLARLYIQGVSLGNIDKHPPIELTVKFYKMLDVLLSLFSLFAIYAVTPFDKFGSLPLFTKLTVIGFIVLMLAILIFAIFSSDKTYHKVMASLFYRRSTLIKPEAAYYASVYLTDMMNLDRLDDDKKRRPRVYVVALPIKGKASKELWESVYDIMSGLGFKEGWTGIFRRRGVFVKYYNTPPSDEELNRIRDQIKAYLIPRGFEVVEAIVVPDEFKSQSQQTSYGKD